MAVQPGIGVRGWVAVVTVGIFSGLCGSLWGATALEEPAVCVYQSAVTNGDAYFAIALRADASKLPTREIRDHAILVDTSASQIGAYRQRALEVVKSYLAALGDTDRVKVYAIDVKAQPMMEGFAAPKSAECDKAAEALATRAPLGATNLVAGLQTAIDDLPVGRPAAIVYIGDGMSAARLASLAEVAKLTGQMRNRRIAVHSVAVGPDTDIEFLGTLAQQTGGVVLFDSKQGASSSMPTGSELAATVKSPLAYPTQMTISGGQGIELQPKTALPIRSDRATVYLGKGRVPQNLTLSFQLAADTQKPPLTFSVQGTPRRNGGAVLAVLWNRAQASGGIAISLAGLRVLAMAEDVFSDQVSTMLNAGEQALKSRDAVTAEQIGRAVRVLDPTNAQAAAILAAVERLKKESATQETNSVVATSLEKRKGPEQDSMTKYRELTTVRGEQLTQEVNTTINDARKLSQEDPDAGIVTLKRADTAVVSAADVDPQVRDQLTRRLRTTVQELRSIKERLNLQKVTNAERLAQSEARRKSLEQMSIEETRLTQLIDQARALLVQAAHGDDNAYEDAEAVAREGIDLRPGNGPATQTMYTAEAAGQLNKAYRLRNLRADRVLETLYMVELAHVPFPDEPSIVWPSPQNWRALTERRKKWRFVDLHSESKTEERISEALDQTVDFGIDPQPLREALDFIGQRFQFPILLDTKALEDASIDPSTEVKINVPGIKLRNMMKLLLEQLPQPLTYVVEDEVMKITTVEKANEKLTIRMYPVGDLIMGAQQLQMQAMMASRMGMMGGGGGGMGGGMMGGMGGGMGGMGGGMGGMGGGMGGMGGGMGGGMFSIPSEQFPPETASPIAQPKSKTSAGKPTTQVKRSQGQVFAQVREESPNSSFTNGSVQTSKKKRMDAR